MEKYIYGMLAAVFGSLCVAYIVWSSNGLTTVLAEHAGFHVRIDIVQTQLNRMEDKLDKILWERAHEVR